MPKGCLIMTPTVARRLAQISLGILTCLLASVILFGDVLLPLEFRVNASLLPNVVNGLIVVLLVGLVEAIVSSLQKRDLHVPVMSRATLLSVQISSCICLFALHAFAFELAGVYTSWDAGGVEWLALYPVPLGPDVPEFLYTYLTHFPNNQFLVWVLHATGAVSMRLLPHVSPMVTFAWASSFCVCTSIFLTSRAALHLTQSTNIAFGSHLLMCALVGLSPWHMIPYTDTFCLPLVAGLLLCGTRLRHSKTLAPAMLGALGVLAYRIKPTSIFLFGFIVLLVLALPLIRSHAERRIALVRALALMASCAILTFTLSALAIGRLGIDEETKAERYPPEYFLVFGLSETGRFNTPDNELTKGQSSYEARQQVERELIAQRLSELGPVGLVTHGLVKSARTWSDGTFAWGDEGDFFIETVQSWKPASELLKSLIYPDGEHFAMYCTCCTLLWLFVLCGIPAGLLAMRRTRDDEAFLLAFIAVCSFALIALFLYLALFETRARYVLHYTPCVVLLSAWGYACRLHMKKVFSVAAHSNMEQTN